METVKKLPVLTQQQIEERVGITGKIHHGPEYFLPFPLINSCTFSLLPNLSIIFLPPRLKGYSAEEWAVDLTCLGLVFVILTPL